MATRKKPKKYFDIVTGNEIEMPEEAVKTEKDIATPDLLQPIIGLTRNPDADLFYAPPREDRPPTVEEVLQREYPDVLRQPEPINVQIAILKELIRMRGCE